jgi:hypothetical protein
MEEVTYENVTYTKVSYEILHKIKLFENFNININFYKIQDGVMIKTEIGDDYRVKEIIGHKSNVEDNSSSLAQLQTQGSDPIYKDSPGISYYVSTNDFDNLNDYIKKKEKEEKEEKEEKYKKIKEDIMNLINKQKQNIIDKINYSDILYKYDKEDFINYINELSYILTEGTDIQMYMLKMFKLQQSHDDSHLKRELFNKWFNKIPEFLKDKNILILSNHTDIQHNNKQELKTEFDKLIKSNENYRFFNAKKKEKKIIGDFEILTSHVIFCYDILDTESFSLKTFDQTINNFEITTENNTLQMSIKSKHDDVLISEIVTNTNANTKRFCICKLKYAKLSQDVLRKIKYQFTNAFNDNNIKLYKKDETEPISIIGDDYQDKNVFSGYADSDKEYYRQLDISTPLAKAQTSSRIRRFITTLGIPYYVLTSDYEKLIKYIEEKEQEEIKRKEKEQEEIKRKREEEIKEYELERQQKREKIKEQIFPVIEKSIKESNLQPQNKEFFLNVLSLVDNKSINPEQKINLNFSNFFKSFDKNLNRKIWSTDKLKNSHHLINPGKTDDLKISINTSNNSLYRIEIEVPHVIFVHDYTDESMPKLSLTKMETGKEYDMEISYSTIVLPGVYNHFNESIEHCKVKIKPQNDEELQIVGDVLYKFGVDDDHIDVDKFIINIQNSVHDEKFPQKVKNNSISLLKSANKNFFYIYGIDEFEDPNKLEKINEKYVKEIKKKYNLEKMKECDVKFYDDKYKLISKSRYNYSDIDYISHVKRADLEKIKKCLTFQSRSKIFVTDCVNGICGAFSRKRNTVAPDENSFNENVSHHKIYNKNLVVPAGGKRTRKNKKTRKHKNKKVFRKIKSFRKIRKR